MSYVFNTFIGIINMNGDEINIHNVIFKKKNNIFNKTHLFITN